MYIKQLLFHKLFSQSSKLSSIGPLKELLEGEKEKVAQELLEEEEKVEANLERAAVSSKVIPENRSAGASFKFVFHPKWKAKLKLGLVQKPKICKTKNSTDEIDNLLKLPLFAKEGDKGKEEILDKLDLQIKKKKVEEQKSNAKFNQEMLERKTKREECQARKKKNAILRNRLEIELTKSKLEAAFQKNLPFLQSIHDGGTSSARHTAFNASVLSRHRLLYNMITDPFTEDQQDWTLAEMTKKWMRNEEERKKNQEYVWKVLLPEFYIKVYGDWFNVDKDAAESMIKDTPLHKRDDSSQGESGEEGNMVA